jgi:hypothetical protein
MSFFKLGLLTCAFYVGLTILLYATFLAVIHFSGPIGIIYRGKHWFWTMGSRFGLVFGFLWFLSFAAAWCIVYADISARISALHTELSRQP